MCSGSTWGLVKTWGSYQGIPSAMPKKPSKANAPSGAAHRRNIDRLRSWFGLGVPSKNAAQ
jgi:hypothetical protein